MYYVPESFVNIIYTFTDVQIKYFRYTIFYGETVDLQACTKDSDNLLS